VGDSTILHTTDGGTTWTHQNLSIPGTYSGAMTGASLPEIGRDFGGKDHSTVVHSCQKIRLLLKSDLDLSKRLADLTEQLRKIS